MKSALKIAILALLAFASPGQAQVIGGGSGAAGVSCSAGTVSLTTLVVTNGLVTHC